MTAAKLSLPVGGRDHVQGPQSAPLTLVEYGDYECPHCGRAYPIVKTMQRELGAELRFVFRNFPLGEIHPHAEAAAEAAEAAAVQDKFWEMHDMLFQHQAELGSRWLLHYAERIALDVARFERDLTTRAFTSRVREDFMSGVSSGVNGTPTFFVNGHRHDGLLDAESLVEALAAPHADA